MNFGINHDQQEREQDSSTIDDQESMLESTEGGFVASTPTPVSRGMIIILGLVVLGGGLLYFMSRKAGPAEATAAVEAQQADQTITKFLDNGEVSVRLMEQMLRDTEKVVQRFLNHNALKQVPLSDLQTNPFRMHAPTAAGSGAHHDDGGLEQRRREEERLAMLKAVEQLQLQSIMFGETRRACMINNTLYVEGQTVQGFTIEQIHPSKIVLRHREYRVEKTLQR